MTPSDGPNFGEALRFESPEDIARQKKGADAQSRGARQQPKRSEEEDDGWGYVDEDAFPKKQHHAPDARPSKKGAATSAKLAGETKYTLKGDKEKVLNTAPEPVKQTPKYPSKKDTGTARTGKPPRSKEPRPPKKEEDDGADGYLSPDDL